MNHRAIVSSLLLSLAMLAAAGVGADLPTSLPLAAVWPVDPAFLTPLTVEPAAVVVQPDGKILVGASMTFPFPGGLPQRGLVRLNRDGSVDPTFNVLGGVDANGGVDRFQLQSDGKVVVAGFFTHIAGVTLATPHRARLNPDGAFDPSFDATLGAPGQIPLAGGRSVKVTFENNVARFARLNADGSADPTYPPLSVVLAPPLSQTPPLLFDAPNYTALTSTVDAQGRIVVAASAYQQFGTITLYRNQSRILRLLADGTLDPAYAVATLPIPLDQIVAAHGKLAYVSTTRSSVYGSITTLTTGRLNPDGSVDGTDRAASVSAGVGEQLPVCRLLADGSTLVVTSGGVVRYGPDGLRDREFSAPLSPSPAGSQIRGLIPIPDGRLLVFGDFTALNGAPTPYLARLTPDTRASATRLTNLSVRQLAGTGNQTLIVGVVIAGQGTKSLLLRGIGPSLALFAVPNPLSDPQLAVFDAAGTLRLGNDNWADPGNAPGLAALAASAGAFPLPAGSKDSAIVAPLSAGSFTMHVGAVGGAAGIALAEGYDTDGLPPDANAVRVVNFSTRATAGAGNASLIAGFTLSGPGVKRVLLRAVGPSLAPFGVTGALADPILTLHAGSSIVAVNDQWGGDPALLAAFASVGAFGFTSPASADAALLLTLPPGSYTAVVTGVGATTGVALVEIYEVP
ncbi:MAG: delta-60 repeat domain-containing protein [Verrucomicrobia bacterium]|nr:delta-60 repeat domain-containing protein [Verrucomicrobiota bacterium]